MTSGNVFNIAEVLVFEQYGKYTTFLTFYYVNKQCRKYYIN